MSTVLEKIRLTEFSHGGGCGCKIAPAVLAELLAATPIRGLPAALLVGTETADDAAVYKLNDSQALVATTDFFTPIVDDPYDFGRIAATNAISDIYAMGAKPIFALALVGMPLDKLPLAVIGKILSGGESVCAQAGIPIAGGHSIDVLEPIYGLVVLGLVHPDKVKRNSSAQAGDVLILGKPLGVGILSAALKKGQLSDAGYAAMLQSTTQLNTPGEALAEMPQVHALTDVTGFGLAGHLLEICRGSQLSAEVSFSELPVLEEALSWVKQGVATGASDRNWKGYGQDVSLPVGAPEWQRKLITDPQTSGGLLVACAPQAEQAVLAEFQKRGFAQAKTIGRLTPWAGASAGGARLVFS
ncbi:MAG: selenide, water dikinase SelD [Betaproteobacteria bacterium]|nr:selenide, water dikinase SelD [Betaproteobacteria bacterium]MSQ88552.1 selenide, water dikinase SelD [Betaproteobacteria bacterium]